MLFKISAFFYLVVYVITASYEGAADKNGELTTAGYLTQDTSDSLSVGALAGIILGCLSFISSILGTYCYCCKYRRCAHDNDPGVGGGVHCEVKVEVNKNDDKPRYEPPKEQIANNEQHTDNQLCLRQEMAVAVQQPTHVAYQQAFQIQKCEYKETICIEGFNNDLPFKAVHQQECVMYYNNS